MFRLEQIIQANAVTAQGVVHHEADGLVRSGCRRQEEVGEIPLPAQDTGQAAGDCRRVAEKPSIFDPRQGFAASARQISRGSIVQDQVKIEQVAMI